MAWTYDPTLAADRDRVRLLVGDTDTADQQLQDEEIDFFVTNEANIYRAASACARAVAAKYARKVDKAVGDLKISYSQRQKVYIDMAADLDSRGMMMAMPYAGGVDAAEKESVLGNDALTQPAFRRGMHDFE